MKSILVIGIGRFGQHLCENLAKHDNQIMAVDIQEEKLEPVLPYVVSAKIGDCTNEAVLKSLGIDNFDICFVCIGNNFQNSLEVTSLISEMGAKYIVSKANRNIHARLLLKNGANEVVYPDRDVAEKAAVRYSANHVFDYTELADGISIYEISPLKAWIGKSIKDLNIRRVYGISIIAIKTRQGHMTFMPGADYVIEPDIHLMVIGKQEDAERIIKRLND
ncbi:MAG: potassium channel family protein [Enterocloster sp.]